MLRKVLMLSTTITTTMVDKKEEDAEYDSDDHGAAGWCGEERMYVGTYFQFPIPTSTVS